MAQRSEVLTPLDGFFRELDTCTACPKLCVHACPVAEAAANERLSPWGKMTMANLMRKGKRPRTRTEAELFYHCLGCMQCTVVCKRQVPVDEVMARGRIEAYREGLHPEALEPWLEKFRRYNNPYGLDLQEMQRRLVDRVFWTETPQAIYLPGSRELALASQHTERVFALFQMLGIDFVGLFVGVDTSLGLSLWRMGFEDLFRKHAFRVYRQLLGFKLIVTSDPEVAYALNVLYPRYGFKLKATVKHISEFLAPYVHNHHNPSQDGRSWCLHHNPVLARHLGVVRPAMKIGALLFERPAVELHWEAQHTWSSGYEEPVSYLYPALSAAIARRRIDEMVRCGARVAVTTSPGDYAHLREHAAGLITVEDLVDLVYYHFAGS